MDHDETSQAVFDMLGKAVAGDICGAATALQTIGMASDNSRMYGVCCAIAEAGKHVLHQLYGEHAPRPGTPDMFVMQELVPGATADDPAEAFALRFLTAWANGDRATTLALFNAALDASDEEYVSSVGALLANVAGLCRLALKRKRA
ncbi:hypothetical protein [Nocardioides sp. NPDC006273]|uniref:hypothetical protein n=1 Tax=Actinomycetes TaxID=1760 RepID=UPI0033AE4ADF